VSLIPHFCSLDQGKGRFDPYGHIHPISTGKLVFKIIGAVAEFEKDIIREGGIYGLNNARHKGKTLG
jgi:DNA invertase Pin-like site-specific DNA recombinase